jgi:pimeloyl-ACP methyl ester carboxylesterase
MDEPVRAARARHVLRSQAKPRVIAALGAPARIIDRLRPRPLLPPAGNAGRFVSVDGVRTYYRLQGCGPALVLLHGLALSHLSWRATSSALAEHFTVYTLDLPGFGYSDKPLGYGSARRTAAFVDRFLATLRLERVTLIGHSLGGAVALWLAIERPTRVERVVLVNVAEIGDAAAIFRVIATPIVGDLLLRTITPATMRSLLAHAYVQKQVVTSVVVASYTRFIRSPGARRALIEHTRAYDGDKRALLPRLRDMSAPALIVWTDQDPYFPLSVAHELWKAVPDADLEVVANAGHVPQEEQAEAFRRIVLGWLHRAVRAADAGTPSPEVPTPA